MEHRIRIALQFLKDGQGFTAGGLRLTPEKGNVIEVRGFSHDRDFGILTESEYLIKLGEVKIQFEYMKSISPDLTQFMADKVVEYSLVYDDYGKGSIDICSEINGILKWNKTLPWAK